MEEMKKFLRFVVPGLIVVVEFASILFLFLLFYDKALLKLGLHGILKYGGGIGIAFTLFLLSGGLGAFLATVYHHLISVPFLEKFNFNYSELLKYCENKNNLRING